MDYNEVLKEFNRIFCEILDDKNIKLEAGTTANDIEDWDSLTHIQLVVEVEKFFEFSFTASEIEAFANVGSMVQFVANKKKNNA